MTNPKYPNITVQLSNEDGNAFAILGRVKRALQRAGIASDEQQQYIAEATSGNYDHLLATTTLWVNVQ